MAEKDKKVVSVPKTATELQRMKLEKLMKDPNKEILIPEGSREWNPKLPPEFIRNVWGSSAGAGSGDFHVYRGVRRREYARQKFIAEQGEKESQDEAYHNKVLTNQKLAEERTSKKRAKRLKKKQKMLAKKQKIEQEKDKKKSEISRPQGSASDEEESDCEDDDDVEN